MHTNIIKAIKSRSDVINNQIHVINNNSNYSYNNNNKMLYQDIEENKGWKQWEHMVCEEWWRASLRIIGVPGENK